MSTLIDEKLKELIRACKKTGNNKKLAVVSFILVGNTVDEISIKLGVKPRNRKKGETIHDHMKLINELLKKNLNVELFKAEHIDIIRGIEPEFLRNEGDIPFQYIQEIFSIYYELRKIDVPNLHEKLKTEQLEGFNEFGSYSLLAGEGSRGSTSKSLDIKTLLLRELDRREHEINRKLEGEFDKELFEEKLYLKNMRTSLEQEGKKKVKVTGALKDNLNYQQSLSDLLGYSFIGTFILFLMLGIIIVIETMYFPELSSLLSPLLLTFFGASVLSFILYWNYFKKDQQ